MKSKSKKRRRRKRKKRMNFRKLNRACFGVKTLRKHIKIESSNYTMFLPHFLHRFYKILNKSNVGSCYFIGFSSKFILNYHRVYDLFGKLQLTNHVPPFLLENPTFYKLSTTFGSRKNSFYPKACSIRTKKS